VSVGFFSLGTIRRGIFCLGLGLRERGMMSLEFFKLGLRNGGILSLEFLILRVEGTRHGVLSVL